jgi:fatty-acyl-CoA synthase
VHWARTRSGDIALVDGAHEVTWEELRRRVALRATELRNADLDHGHTVALIGGNSMDWCVTALAVLDIGATILPVNHRTTVQELSFLIEHAGCAAIVADAARFPTAEETTRMLEPRPEVLTMRSETGPSSRVAGDAPSFAPRQDDPPAIVAYTSGTTGRPKGVELTHANLVIGSWSLAAADASRDVRVLLVQPLSYTSGLISTFLASIINGWTLVLEPGFDPERALHVLEQRKVTTFRSVPLLWKEIAAVAGFAGADLSHLRTAHVGGAPVPEDLMGVWQERGIALCQGYGLTETCGAVTFATPAQALANRRTVGTGGPHCDIEVRGSDGAVVDRGVVGEIHVRGPAVTRGYRGDPDATRAAIEGGWLRTGDLATRDEDGLLEIVGRGRDLIISGGINVYPAEIETFMSGLPGVDEVAVVAVSHPRFTEVPAAVVHAEPGVTAEYLIARCREGLAAHKVPHVVILVDHPLPRTESGKLVKRSLQDRYFSGVEA